MAARLSSPRFVRRATLLAALVFLAGVVAFVTTLVGGGDSGADARPAPTAPALTTTATPASERTVPVPNAAKQVAADFILSAVTREDLAKAWKITDPTSDLRVCGASRCTYAEWLKGDIAVQPYPADQLRGVTYKVDESRPNRVVLQVVLLPKEGATLKSQIFFIGLKAVGSGKAKRWLVDYWAPRAVLPVPVLGDN